MNGKTLITDPQNLFLSQPEVKCLSPLFERLRNAKRYEIHLEMNPVPQKRARSSKLTGTFYNPQAQLKLAVKAYLLSQFDAPFIEKACWVNAFFWFQPPESWSQKKKERALGLREPKIYHDCKPDKDNLEKFINDCLDKTVIKNDAKIYGGILLKDYRERPGIDLYIYVTE